MLHHTYSYCYIITENVESLRYVQYVNKYLCILITYSNDCTLHKIRDNEKGQTSCMGYIRNTCGTLVKKLDCIHAPQNRDQWWVLVNMVKTLCVPLKVR
jgi:hypothetical protein